ncbi:MAG: adenylate/guanylate cyclase domain-containing protein, partial [Alphaproteobacteria bacterium]|nr:adenylate/guanylate cyclase domain-containing protein [Alphaproteobacteria bacterium]
LVNFGVPDSSPIDCSNALSTALGLLQAIDLHNATADNKSKHVMKLGIGIHYGMAVLGDVGSKRSAAFTTIGDTINVASRLQTLTREYNARLIVSDEFAQQLLIERGPDEGNHLRRLGFTQVNGVMLKGRQAEVSIWKL